MLLFGFSLGVGVDLAKCLVSCCKKKKKKEKMQFLISKLESPHKLLPSTPYENL